MTDAVDGVNQISSGTAGDRGAGCAWPNPSGGPPKAVGLAAHGCGMSPENAAKAWSAHRVTAPLCTGGSLVWPGTGVAGCQPGAVRRSARGAACTRPETPSLRRMLVTWTLAVLGLIYSSAPISALVRPAVSRRSTSSSGRLARTGYEGWARVVPGRRWQAVPGAGCGPAARARGSGRAAARDPPRRPPRRGPRWRPRGAVRR